MRMEALDSIGIYQSRINDSTLNKKYNEAQVSYISFYKSKSTVTNQLATDNPDQAIQNSQIFANMSEKCYTIVEETKQNEIILSVTQEVNQNGRELKIQRMNIALEPVAKAFRVLSLNSLSTNVNGNRTTSFFLNIAFELEYKEIGSHKINMQPVKSFNEPSTVQLSPVVAPVLTEGTFSVDEVKEIIFDNDKHMQWQFYPDKPTSIADFYIESAESGYRLPSYTELKGFFDKIAYQEQKNNHLFTKLFNFPGESATFASLTKMIA